MDEGGTLRKYKPPPRLRGKENTTASKYARCVGNACRDGTTPFRGGLGVPREDEEGWARPGLSILSLRFESSTECRRDGFKASAMSIPFC